LKRVLLIFLLGLFCILSISYGWLILRRPPLNEEVRKGLPGSFVRLTRGFVHYELSGPKDGQAVVLIHGFTTPSFIWDPTVPRLVEAGFRVLRYDLYGRGFSDRPRLRYGPELFDAQLLELIRTLNIRTPVHLVGFSMGGAIAVYFADRHPKLVSKICLLAPMGFPVQVPFVRKLAIVPLLGDYLMAIVGESILKKGVRANFYRPDRFFPQFLEKFSEQMKFRGYLRAILSTLRHMSLEPIQAAYRRVGRQRRPIMLIWGREDSVLPFQLSERVREAIPDLRFHPVEEAGHAVHYERPEVVNPLLVRFLQGPTATVATGESQALRSL